MPSSILSIFEHYSQRIINEKSILNGKIFENKVNIF
jgi:hypothetical protein